MPPGGVTSPGTSAGLDVTIESARVRFGAGGGAVMALDDCTFAVPAGSFTAIIGPNGCGKSTLLRLVAGLIEPGAGEIQVGGAPPHPGDGRVAMGFQQPRLVPWRTTYENVVLPLELLGVPSDERQERGQVALERVGLSSLGGLHPGELSGGMQQRAALARALITDPPVLLLDEPFSALDALTRETFDAELERLWTERPRTVLFVTHAVSEAVQLADRVAVMSARPGRVTTVVDVRLPRPRSGRVEADVTAAAAAETIRAALEASHPVELRAWADEATA